MDNNERIYFQPADNQDQGGFLIIGYECTLDEVYKHQYIPVPLKQSLQKMITWHARNETTVDKAIHSLQRFPQFRAFCMAIGIDHQPDQLRIPVNMPNIRIASAEVRATPADEPIVAAYVYINLEENKINVLRTVITGAHSESPYLVRASEKMQGMPFTQESLPAFIEMMENELIPQSDYLGSAEYRKAMAKITVQRAFLQCLEEK